MPFIELEPGKVPTRSTIVRQWPDGAVTYEDLDRHTNHVLWFGVFVGVVLGVALTLLAMSVPQ